MASRTFKLIATSGALALAAGYGLYVTAQTAPPELAQAPMNITNVIPPAFIMAVDDSGSMTFQNQFPAADGYAWWSENAASFFSSPGVMRTSGSTNFAYSYTGPRISTGFRGIPPVDTFGFARSPDYNPAYFNPLVSYKPWLNSDGTPYGSTTANPAGNASTTATRIDPRLTATINLAATLAETNDRSLFRAAEEMVLPAGTVLRLRGNNNCGGINDGAWRTVGSGGHRMQNDCDMYISHYPATFFLQYTSDADARPAPLDAPTAYASVPRVRVRDACGAGCDLWKYSIRSTDTEALQNFANWFSFYGNRNRAMVAGMTRSMTDITNMRVGYFTINSNYVDVSMRDMAVADQKGLLYNSMLALPASGSTPNLPAVAHMGSQFRRVGTGAPVQKACQKNGGMLFTDGFSNVAASATAVTNLGAPFDSTPANSMAAIASRYYFDTAAGGSPLIDAATLPAGLVPVPDECATLATSSVEWKRLDCQKNLHMNFYGVTLGGRGNIYNPDIEQDPYVLNPAWPGYESGERSTVDDIWHATVNTRGEFISAKTPVDIVEAMRRILAAVGEGASPSGTIGLTGSRIGAGSLTVQPRYEASNNGTDWYSTLEAQTITTDPMTGIATFSSAWEASAKIAAQASRNIRFGSTGSSVVPAVADFSASNVSLTSLCAGSLSRCSAAEIEALATGMNATRAVAYLRGSRADEGALRTRTTLLGDIVNSSPAVISPTDDYGYRAFGGTLSTSYAAYLTSKKTLNRPLVLVGANDGMFHVFDGQASAAGGEEVFAYIPATAVGHMGNLLFPYDPEDKNDQKFQHRYYVDGPITVSDINVGGVWKTIAVGTSGAGGRSVFALDITNPSAITVLWEVNNLITGDAGTSDNIGHVLSRPVIVPVKNTAGAVSWKVIFGNGYNSANQQARLFVVDAASGATSTILAEESSPPAFNGLGSLAVVDRKRVDGASVTAGRDGFSDTVYAADLNGAVWKFDLLTNSLALSEPLYVARDGSGVRQSITGGLTTATGPAGGVMVYFGTGSFAFTNDPDSTAQQTLYAVLDRGVSVANRSQLHAQTVGATAGDFRSTTTTQMTAGKSGWYLDLPSGERFVGNPRIESGVVFFPSYEASANATTDCSVAGKNWLYGLNALSGAAALTNVRIGSPTGTQPGTATGAVALSTGGSAPVRDVSVLTAPRLAPLTGTPTQAEIDAALAAQCSMVIRVAGADPLYLPRPCGRQSWRQVR